MTREEDGIRREDEDEDEASAELNEREKVWSSRKRRVYIVLGRDREKGLRCGPATRFGQEVVVGC